MKLQNMIENALQAEYTMCYPIEDFTIEDLVKLSGIAKENKVELRIRKESSNFYQGTFLEVQRFHDRIDCRRSDEK